MTVNLKWQLTRDEELSSSIAGSPYRERNSYPIRFISEAGDSEELLYFDGLHGPCRRLESEGHGGPVGFRFRLVLFYTTIPHIFEEHEGHKNASWG